MTKTQTKNDIFQFALLVKNWSASYSFGIAVLNPKLRSNSEYEHYDTGSFIQIDCITYQDEPNLKVPANTEISVKIALLNNDELDDRPHKSTGYIQTYKEDYPEVVITMPKKDLNYLTQLLQTNNKLGISFASHKLRYNKALVTSFDITTNFNPAEF